MPDHVMYDIPDFYREKLNRGAVAQPGFSACPRYPYKPGLMGTFHERDEERLPFYKAYPDSVEMQSEESVMEELDKYVELYPKTAQMILGMVEEAADRMDYAGSMIYDEVPDPVQIERLTNEIYERFLLEEQPEGYEQLMVTQQECRGCRNGGPVMDLIKVLLYQETCKRRCRCRGCRRRR